MEFSSHAMARGQQRGISQETVDLILLFGGNKKKPGNAREYKIKKRDTVEIISNLKHAIQSLEKARKKAVLLSREEDIVITVYASC